MSLFNDPSGKKKRQTLRKNIPNAERLLWAKIRGNQLLGFKFRRQHGIGPYVADFYCPELNLVVEIDGDSHFKGNGTGDRERQGFIESKGIAVMRFTNGEVYNNLDGVIRTLEGFAKGE